MSECECQSVACFDKLYGVKNSFNYILTHRTFKGKHSSIQQSAEDSKTFICHRLECLQTNLTVLIQMDLILGSETGSVSSTDILNSADSLQTKKLKKSETEHLLSRLVMDKWLNEVQSHGKYALPVSKCYLCKFR